MTEQYLPTNINDPRIVRIEDGDYQITLDDSIIAASAPTVPVTLTLPEARTLPGWTVCVKAQDTTGGSITVQGLNGQLIDGNPTTVLAADNDSVVLQSIGDSWAICGGGSSSGGGDTCLTTFLVATDPALAPYTSIQAAYDAAVAAGAGADTPAKVLVCPGTYVEDVTMNTPGIDIVAVSTHRENSLDTAAVPGVTRLQGQLVIDLNNNPGAGTLNRCQWVGIDVEPVDGTTPTPGLEFAGATEQYATVSDCQIFTFQPAPAAGPIVCSNSGDSDLNLVRVTAFASAPPLTQAATVLAVTGADCSANLNDCRLNGQAFGDGFFSDAITQSAGGCTVNAVQSRIGGAIRQSLSLPPVGAAQFRDCQIFSTQLDIAGGTSMRLVGCEISRYSSAIPWATGSGTLEFDYLTWSVASQGNSLGGTGLLAQLPSTPAGQPYFTLVQDTGVIPFFITSQTNVLVDTTAFAQPGVNLPAAAERFGPIRVKANSVASPALLNPVGGDTINGAAGPIPIPTGGITLVSDGAGDWQTWD